MGRRRVTPAPEEGPDDVVRRALDAVKVLSARVAELEAQHVTDTEACLAADRERNQARRERDEALVELDAARTRVRYLEEPRPIVRADADPSTERTQRVVFGHLLSALREAATDTTTVHVVDALAVLLGVDRG